MERFSFTVFEVKQCSKFSASPMTSNWSVIAQSKGKSSFSWYEKKCTNMSIFFFVGIIIWKKNARMEFYRASYSCGCRRTWRFFLNSHLIGEESQSSGNFLNLYNVVLCGLCYGEFHKLTALWIWNFDIINDISTGALKINLCNLLLAKSNENLLMIQ